MRTDPAAVAQVMRHLAQARPGMCVWPDTTRDVPADGYEPPHVPVALHDHDTVRMLAALADVAERSLYELAPDQLDPEAKERIRTQLLAEPDPTPVRPAVHVDHRPAPWRPRWRPRWRWTVAGPGHDPAEGWAWTRRGAQRRGTRAADLAYRRTRTGR